MGRFLAAWRRYCLVLLLLLMLGAGVAWFERVPLLSWYYLNGLAGASVEDRDLWVGRLVTLDRAAVPGLLDQLAGEDEQVCQNMAAALVALAQQWGAGDERTGDLSRQLAEGFPNYQRAGQEAVLDWQLATLKVAGPDAGDLRRQAAAVLAKAAANQEDCLRSKTLALAELLVDSSPTPACRQTVRDLIGRELSNPTAAVRVKALHLTLRPAYGKDNDLLRRVVPLLRDPEACVRSAALLALGSAKDVVSEEEMLFLLHDQDPEVRRLCEAALQSRGLHDGQILLGRLISDPRPAARLQIVHHLPEVEDVEPGVWLNKLSQDPADAVRAAAVRLAASFPGVNFTGRLTQMAANDPSETVRQLARFYLARRSL